MTFNITESERERILLLHEMAQFRQRLAECRVTSNGKYVIFQNEVFSTETGEPAVLTEAWSTSDILHTVGDLASAGMDFVIPGSGAIIDTINAVSYIIEAQFKKDPQEKKMLYVMGAITFAFVVIPGPIQAVAPALKRFVKGGAKVATKPVRMGLNLVRKHLDKILGGFPEKVAAALTTKLGKRLTGRFGQKISIYLQDFAKRTKKVFDEILAPRQEYKQIKKARWNEKGRKIGRTVARTKILLPKESILMKKFWQGLPRIAKGEYVMKKFGFVPGKTYAFLGKAGGDPIKVKIIGGSGDGILLKYPNGSQANIKIGNFLQGVVGFPWIKKGMNTAVPLYIKMFARAINSDGTDLDYDILDRMPNLSPDQTSLESLNYIRSDVAAAYQGNNRKYTVNPVVQSVQKGLVLLGYKLPSGIDGKFGPETKRAVEQFQSDASLESSRGVIDRLTARKIATELRAREIPNSEKLQKTLNNF